MTHFGRDGIGMSGERWIWVDKEKGKREFVTNVFRKCFINYFQLGIPRQKRHLLKR